MDAQIRLFFNRLYQIVGIDTQEKRDELLLQFENTLVGRAIARFMDGLTSQEQNRYDDFLRSHLKASNEEVASYMRALRPGFDFEKLFNEEAQTLTEAYVKKVLTAATEEQKQKIKAVFAEMFNVEK